MSTRSNLYRAASFLGDWNAAKRGPHAMVKRIIRKSVYRSGNKIMRRLTR